MTIDSLWEPRPWIVTPGLVDTLIRFEIRCEAIINKKRVGKHSCLLIRGETGVGKSMFAEYFVHKYLKQFPNSKILFINCSAIPETLLESELFGYKKGSSSVAFKDKLGLFEIAGDGVIVLEELGEIPKELQAKLLIAIENRTYFAIGDSKAKKLNAQIVATSNAEKNKFRTDFWYRFENFNIPPLHQRRMDILYYIQNFDPEIINLLTGGVVLALLCYNWPGNVREVERICNIIRGNIQYARLKKMIPDDSFEFNIKVLQKQQYELFFNGDPDVSSFCFDKGLRLASKMIAMNIKVEYIEVALNAFALSLNCYSSVLNKQELQKVDIKDEHVFSLGNGKIKFVQNCLFIKFFAGIIMFSTFFSQDFYSSKDLLELSSPVKFPILDDGDIKKRLLEVFKDERFTNTDAEPDFESVNIISFLNSFHTEQLNPLNNFMHIGQEFKIIVLECTKYLTGIQSIALDDLNDLRAFYKRHRENEFLAKCFGDEPQDKHEEISIDTISIDEIRELYYETLCSVVGMAHGYKKRIAAIAKRTPGRITQEFEELGLNQKFTKLNNTPRKRLAILK